MQWRQTGSGGRLTCECCPPNSAELHICSSPSQEQVRREAEKQKQMEEALETLLTVP